jgi:hypothetical protein
MAEEKSSTNPEISVPYRVAEFFFFMIKRVGELISEFGMPTVAFGSGISVVVLLIRFDGKNAIVYQVAVGLTLVALGLIAQLFIHFRDNPQKFPLPPPTDPALEMLLVKLTNIIADSTSPAPTNQVLAKQLKELTKIVDKAVQNSDKKDD